MLDGEREGDNDLGSTFVPADTLVSILYTHTGPLGTDGPRIISLSVAEVEAEDCVLGDVNRSGNVDFLDIPPFISLLVGGEFSCEGDVDQNEEVNFADIPPFIELLQNGS